MEKKLHNEGPFISTISLLVEKMNNTFVRTEICTEYWWRKLKDKRKFKDVNLDG